MVNIIIAAATIVFAVVMGILAVALPPANINILVVISKFFEVMIPFLAVGALIKYLLGCNHKNRD